MIMFTGAHASHAVCDVNDSRCAYVHSSIQAPSGFSKNHLVHHLADFRKTTWCIAWWITWWMHLVRSYQARRLLSACSLAPQRNFINTMATSNLFYSVRTRARNHMLAHGHCP
jgi:hypothetical protein